MEEQRRHGSPLEREGREGMAEADPSRERRAARHLYLYEPQGHAVEKEARSRPEIHYFRSVAIQETTYFLYPSRHLKNTTGHYLSNVNINITQMNLILLLSHYVLDIVLKPSFIQNPIS